MSPDAEAGKIRRYNQGRVNKYMSTNNQGGVMTSANTVRYSGAVAVAAGLLLAVGWIGDPDRLNALFAALIIVGHVLILLAMAGLYDRYRGSIGWMGQLGIALAVAGNALYIALIAIIAYVRIEIEVGGVLLIQEDLLETDRMAAFSPIGPSMFAAGYLLLGIEAVLRDTFSRLAALMLIAGGALLLVAMEADVSSVYGLIGAVVFSVGLGWIGFTLWSESGPGADD